MQLVGHLPRRYHGCAYAVDLTTEDRVSGVADPCRDWQWGRISDATRSAPADVCAAGLRERTVSRGR
jgi:hypothetical protein